MIVQCENCETRFHVADARIPEKGARVRCSRCHHRFHITPSSGTTSSPNSGPDVSARTETRSRETEGAAGAGGGGGDDLENPEFLFEGNSVSETKGGAAAPEPKPEPAPAEAAATPQPEAPRHAPDLEPAQAPEVRVVETSGKTAQEMLDAGAPKLAPRTGPVEFAPSLEDPDSDDTRSRFRLSDESPPTSGTPTTARTPREPPPSLRPAKTKDKPAKPSKPAKPTATLTPIAKPPVPAPKPTPAKAEKSPLDLAFGGSIGEEEEPDSGWESLTQSESEESGESRSVFDVGATFGLGGSTPSVPTAAPGGKPATLFDQPDVGGKKRAAHEPAVFDPEAASPAGTIARAAALLVGIALLCGTLRGLELQRAASVATSEADQGAGWIATDVETFVARDSLGERVLVVRGNLFPNGAAPPPEVSVTLLATGGDPVGEPRRAWLERLDDAEIAPDALTVKLASSSGDLSGMGPQVTGFTALLADPPAAARRIQVNLASGKLSPRGTATAVVPAPATPPPSEPGPQPSQLAAPTAPQPKPTELAVPKAPEPKPSQLAVPAAPQAKPKELPPDAVVPAAPEPE